MHAEKTQIKKTGPRVSLSMGRHICHAPRVATTNDTNNLKNIVQNICRNTTSGSTWLRISGLGFWLESGIIYTHTTINRHTYIYMYIYIYMYTHWALDPGPII